MKDLTDIEIMRNVQGGDTRQVGLLYERHKQNLFNYFYRCSNDYVVSEDMVQNVFIKVLKYSDKFKGTGEFNYWLFRIARNTWLDSLKKNDPLHHVIEYNAEKMEDSYSIKAGHVVSMDEKKQKLQRALNQISPEKREAIVLSRYHGYDYKTIAELSNCTENAIKARVMRGILELKEIVKSY